jgi:diaminopimelate epimerase
MLIEKREGGLKTRLFNSDGSEPEISGNGTRCAAAFALWNGIVDADMILIETAAGLKTLKVLEDSRPHFEFEMNMGVPRYSENEIRTPIELDGRQFDATILNVGNPQCALFVDDLPGNWRVYAQLAESRPQFPNRTNVSFVKVTDRHNIDVVFYERGAGETRSSGTGSTGAAAASILRSVCASPVTIHTPAGTMTLRWDDSVYLTGPAEFIAEGVWFAH